MFNSLIAFCLGRRPLVLLGLVLFFGAGLVAFKLLNIEAYPNPTPVILEITAQAPGLSAEEMERYYTRPMEIGLYTTPGIDVIRVAAVNSWGGPTKQFQVEVDPHRLEAYNVTVPEILNALGNANINVGGREITDPSRSGERQDHLQKCALASSRSTFAALV
jgi:Cu/Ag efflux pump CusA